MSELIYHTSESSSGGCSPFDEALEAVTSGKRVAIACPYVAPSVLQDVSEWADSWRLLTDLSAWSRAFGRSQREAMRDIVTEAPGGVRGYDDLHAKVVLGESEALFGSANLTEKGLTGREELGIRISDVATVAELSEWFERLWESGESIDHERFDDFTESVRPETSALLHSEGRANQMHGTPPVRSKRVREDAVSDYGSHEPSSVRKRSVRRDDADVRDRLVARLQKAPERDWANRHFDLMRQLLELAGLSEDDPQVVTSVPKSMKEVRMILGHRVVFGFVGKTGDWTRYILPADMNGLAQVLEEVPHDWEFSGEETPPHLPAFTDGLDQVRDPAFRRAWFRAALREAEWDGRSPYRSRSHEPIVYRTATDPAFRKRILDEAFPD